MEKLKGETNDDFFAITAATFLYMDIENLGKLIHLQFVHGNISEWKNLYIYFKIYVIEILNTRIGMALRN
jgi:hypothetical protein